MLGAKHSEIRRSHAVINARNTSLLPATPSSPTRRHHFDAAFHYAPSDDFTSDAPPRRRVPLRAAAYSRPTFVNTRQLRAALLNAPPFHLASDAPQHLRRRAIACTGQSTRSRAPGKTIRIQNILPSRTIANFQNDFNFLNSHREAITVSLLSTVSSLLS